MSDSGKPEGSHNLPTIESLCLNEPLYSEFLVKDREYMRTLKSGDVQFDAYCVGCNKESIFIDTREHHDPIPAMVGDYSVPQYRGDLDDDLILLEMKCTRRGHQSFYIFLYENSVLKKIGQYPSLEDVAGADIKKYRKILYDPYFAELHRATGLASHGIGIGAFVYLRRIFERLIQDHYQLHVGQHGEIDDFQTLRMDEKISALQENLPSALVANKATYGILSTGVHELDENTCKRYFPVVRAAIILMLEEDLKVRAAKDAESVLKEEIAQITGEIKSSK